MYRHPTWKRWFCSKSLHNASYSGLRLNMRNTPGVRVNAHKSSYCPSANICHLIVGFWFHLRIVAIQQSFWENQRAYDTNVELSFKVCSGNAAWVRGEKHKWEEVLVGWPIISQMRSIFVSHHLFLIMFLLIKMSAGKHLCLLLAVKHYSGFFMSLDVVSRWNHEKNATLLDSKITLYFYIFYS